jgi:thiamine-monophosphate kinase
MIDISDGLSSELLHLCKNSNVGARIFDAKLPIDVQTMNVADELKITPVTMALNGGEDYELLFPVKAEYSDLLKQHEDISIIGYTTSPEEGVHLADSNNHLFEMRAQGWESFKS